MSKLRNHRGTSKGEFVNKPIDIRQQTGEFLSRLSARYGRLYAQDAMHLANKLAAEAEQAQSMKPVDATRYELRKGHLLEARAALKALDNILLDVYMVLTKNPLGAFDDLKKKAENCGKESNADRIRRECAEEAVKRLDHMSENLGCLIDEEEALLNGVLDSDKRDFNKARKRQ